MGESEIKIRIKYTGQVFNNIINCHFQGQIKNQELRTLEQVFNLILKRTVDYTVKILVPIFYSDFHLADPHWKPERACYNRNLMPGMPVILISHILFCLLALVGNGEIKQAENLVKDKVKEARHSLHLLWGF